MKTNRQYLERYAAPEALAIFKEFSDARAGVKPASWEHVLVIPAYRENTELLDNLEQFSNLLLVLVLNRPDSDTDPQCNDTLRKHVRSFKMIGDYPQANCTLHKHGEESGNHILLVERAEPLPHKEGVGLARKIGCDIALALCASGVVTSPWIHCSDADAILSADYFSAVQVDDTVVALTYSFEHSLPAHARERQAIFLYEEYLNHYVQGLAKAGSPYAFHTIGSCIAVRADTYAAVRGFPRRAAGEDFYLLNKVAKHGSIRRPVCAPIRLSARLSNRAPFGTGPSMATLLASDDLASVAFFYDHRCFDALGALIAFTAENGHPGITLENFTQGLGDHPELLSAIRELGLDKFLQHAKKQCADQGAFIAQFHGWLDGFRTLKLIHALTHSWPKVTAAESTRGQTRR